MKKNGQKSPDNATLKKKRIYKCFAIWAKKRKRRCLKKNLLTMVFSRKLDFFSVAEKMFFSSIYSHISSIKDIFVLKQIITLVKDIFHVKISKAPKHTCFKQCSRAGAGGAKIILRPGAGAKIIFTINIFCCQFGGC